MNQTISGAAGGYVGVNTGGNAGYQKVADNIPKAAIDVHAESPVGQALIRAANQGLSLKAALETLRIRLKPVLACNPSSIGGDNKAKQIADSGSPSALSSDVNMLYYQISSCTDDVHEILNSLTI